MITLVILSMIVLAGYTAAVCIKTKGIPYSISATYYSLNHKLIFGACMTMTAMFLFPAVWELSTTFTMRLLSISACAGLIGVGLAPDFRDSWVNKIHCWSAALTLVSSQLWVGCTSFWWILIFAWLSFTTWVLYYTITHSDFFRGNVSVIGSKPMFWCEVAAVSDTYITIFLIMYFM